MQLNFSTTLPKPSAQPRPAPPKPQTAPSLPSTPSAGQYQGKSLHPADHHPQSSRPQPSKPISKPILSPPTSQQSPQAVQSKKDKVKQIILNRRQNIVFAKPEARAMQLPKVEGLIEEREAKREEVFSDTTFESLGLAPALIKGLTRQGFTTLTKIQLEIFHSLQRRANAVVRSVTGSGKTLAYLVPIFHDLLTLPQPVNRSHGIYVLILSPTRELCAQIYQVALKLCYGCVNIVPGMFVGGEDLNHEKSRLRKGINILVSTPARLIYHLNNTKNLTLNSLRTLVVEESDLSLSMGQGENVRKIVEQIHSNRPDHLVQKIFTTACYDQRVRTLIDECLSGNYELVGGLNVEDAKKDLEKEEVLIPEQLKQNYVLVEENSKLSYLVCLLHGLQNKKCIVFVSTADQANFLERALIDLRHLPPRHFEEHYTPNPNAPKVPLLQELNEEPKILTFPILKLHGHIPQDERLKVYQQFSVLKNGLLISTDVGSRGLDFPDVNLIILYDPPESLAHYSNRVGRTARLTKAGSSLVFLHPVEDLFIRVLSKRYPIHEFNPLKSFEAFEPCIPQHYPITDSIEYLNHAIKKRVSADNELFFMARRAYNSFCRAYSRIKNKTVFNLKNLHLHNLAKSFGLKGAKSTGETEKDQYLEVAENRLDRADREISETARQKSEGRIKLRAKNDKVVLKNEFL